MTGDRKLIEDIQKLKAEQNAVIVAHTYQNDEIQEIADMVGDSFALSKFCASKECSTIVFCGVGFMAESAKILSPEKKVLLPEKSAGCPMADMVSAEGLRDLHRRYPEAAVVTYINSSAAVKAESDVVVTSSNALKVVRNLQAKKIIFAPDKNLGSFVADHCPDKDFILWKGYCPTHNNITKEIVWRARSQHPNAQLLIHPECPTEALALADYVGSTKEIIEYATDSDQKEFIIGTEKGVLYPLRRDNPGKKFYLLDEELVCSNMKITTLESVRRCLETGTYEMTVDPDVAERARKALNRMLELAAR